MAGTKNDVLVAKNADFSQAAAPNPQSSENNGLISDGQLWIGTTALNVGGTHISVGKITSPSGTLSIGYSSPNITMDLAGGGIGIDSLTPNSGTTPVVPDVNGNITLQGDGSITTVGGLNSLTPQLTGLTNHAVLVGAGTSTITKVGPTATAGQVLQSSGALADPAFSTATYPSSTTINQVLYSSAANTVTGLASINRGAFVTNSSGVPNLVSLNGNGLIVIGSASSQPAAGNLTAGTGISIVNGANTITINSAGGGVTWSDTSGVATMSSNNGYFVTGAATPTLPASPSSGDVVEFVVLTAALCTVTANAGQKINLAGSLSATAGTASTSTAGFTLKLVYRSTGATWWAIASEGSWTIT